MAGAGRDPRSGWSLEQQLAHITAWERSLIALLAGASRPAAMGVPEELWQGHDTAAVNAWLVRRAAGLSAAAVHSDFEAVHAQTRSAVAALEDADLARPYSDFDPTPPPDLNPVVGWIAGNTWEHYDEHSASVERLSPGRGA